MAAPFGLSGTERLTSFSSLPAGPVHVGLAGELQQQGATMKQITLPRLYSKDHADQCDRCGTHGSTSTPLTWMNGTWRCSTECRG